MPELDVARDRERAEHGHGTGADHVGRDHHEATVEAVADDAPDEEQRDHRARPREPDEGDLSGALGQLVRLPDETPTKKTPSPNSDTLIPNQSKRKSRSAKGPRMPTRRQPTSGAAGSSQVLLDEPVVDSVLPGAVPPVRLAAHALAYEAGTLEEALTAPVETVHLELNAVVALLADQVHR